MSPFPGRQPEPVAKASEHKTLGEIIFGAVRAP